MKTRAFPSSNRYRLIGICALSLISLVGCTIIPADKTATTPPRPTSPSSIVVSGWTGTYRTILPCSYCAGIRLDLTLYRDATYDLLTQELGTDRPPITRRGGFTFNNNETRIMLDANGQGREFDLLPPDRLRMLNRDGQPVSGRDAYRFILKK